MGELLDNGLKEAIARWFWVRTGSLMHYLKRNISYHYKKMWTFQSISYLLMTISFPFKRKFSHHLLAFDSHSIYWLIVNSELPRLLCLLILVWISVIKGLYQGAVKITLPHITLLLAFFGRGGRFKTLLNNS